MVYLTVAELVAIHDEMIRLFPNGDAGPGNLECVDAAAALPQQSAFGEDAYPTLPEKAAAYLFHVAKKHCFPDGNKRTAVVSALTFLRKNGYYLGGRGQVPEANQLAQLALDVVTNRCAFGQLARWFQRRLVPLSPAQA